MTPANGPAFEKWGQCERLSHCQGAGQGGKFMPHHPRAAKKPYSSPSLVLLDASAAKAKLQAKGDPKDPIAQRMLSLIDEQLKGRKAKSH